MTRDELLGIVAHDNVSAFLRLIRQGESSQDDSAYTVMFGGKHFESIEDHPRIKNTAAGLTSTAAGAYQFLARTWDEMAKQYGLNDFGPTNQDIAACGLILRRKALDDVVAGRIHEAIRKCRLEWASLPGSTYGQPTQKLEKAIAVYQQYGGRLASQAAPVAVAPKEVKPMAPIVLPLLEMAASLIPQLGSLFGSGSEVSNRNLQAGKVIADTLVKATESVNLQEAVERIQNDPASLQAAKAAVAQVWPEITESGGGGIKAAREAAFAPDQVPFWRNPAFVIALAILPLVYMVATSILFGVGQQTWSDDIKMMFVTAVVSGALGSITGFFLGSSLGSQKKDSLLGGR